MTEFQQEPAPHPTRRDYAMLLLGLIAAMCFLCMLAFKHPSDYGVIPSCPFHSGTGFLCPGCGSMRATHYFITGHFATSLHYNPLVLIVLPLVTYLGLKWFCAIFLHKEIPFPYQTTVYWVIAVIFIVFFIARNIPLDAFDLLRPPPRNAMVFNLGTLKNVTVYFHHEGHEETRRNEKT